jgi:DNA replicative helicase MCM subunit Mcm2 (Cdc46/Mcm family)
MNFTLDDENISGLPFYMNELKMAGEVEDYSLNIDCDHLFRHDQKLYSQLQNFPSEMIPYFDIVATQIFKDISHDMHSQHVI